MEEHSPRPVCPQCGTAMALHGEKEICPACLMFGGLEEESGLQEHSSEAGGGLRFQHYEVMRRADGSMWELGRGAMGTTFKAFDTNLRCPVALKVIGGSYLDNEMARQRFLREARAAAQLRHPNVASVFHLGTSGSSFFYVMEYVDGENLETMVLRDGALPIALALNITAQVASALLAASRQHLVHRDIKPANLMIVPADDGGVCVKVIDFGLAKLAANAPRQESRFLTQGGFVGTPSFASPEQLASASVDSRSDIYSLGITLWFMLTERVPDVNRLALREDHPESLAEWHQVAHAPEPALALLRSMLAADPTKRPANPGELRDRLRDTMRSLSLQFPSMVTTESPAPHAGESRVSRRRRMAALLLAIVVAGAVVAGWRAYSRAGSSLATGASSGPVGKSIAVLPFQNLNHDQANEYFTNGITDDVTSLLARISDLKVISRNASRSFKEDADPRLVAQKLDVATVLTGSVRRQDDRVRVSVELVDAQSSRVMWSDSYDRDVRDVFGIQNELAQKIAIALEAKLTDREQAGLNRKPTESISAYQYYLKGREFYDRYRQSDNEQAITFFQKAIQTDDNYAAAYAGLADAYGQRVTRWGAGEVWIDRAIESARKAIAIDSNCAEGYKALGLAFLAQRRYSESLEPSLRAVQLNPNYVVALNNVGFAYRESGHPEQALPWLLKAVKLDPLSAIRRAPLADDFIMLAEDKLAIQEFERCLDLEHGQMDALVGLSRVKLSAGKFDESRVDCIRALAIDPEDHFAQLVQAQIELYSGNWARALPLYERLTKLEKPDDGFGGGVLLAGVRSLSALGFLESNAGKATEAEAHLNEAARLDRDGLAKSPEFAPLANDLAAVLATQGKADEAIVEWQKALRSGWLDFRATDLDPRFRKLKGDARFAAMLNGLGSKVAELRQLADQQLMTAAK